MNSFQLELLNAAKKQRVTVARSSSWSGETLHRTLAERFGTDGFASALWERLRGGASMQNPEGWTVPARFVGESPCLLSFEPRLDGSVLELRRGADLTDLLGECSGFVFYVCDEEISYLFCFNDHDYLTAFGKAEPWLRAQPGA